MVHDDPHDDGETGPDELDDELDDGLDDARATGVVEPLRRTHHGPLGTMIGAAMLGLDQVLGRKPREEAPIVVAASGEPGDVDADGIVIPLDEHTELVAPPLPVAPPVVAPPRRRRLW